MIAEHVRIHRFKREISLHHIAIVAIETVGFKNGTTLSNPLVSGPPATETSMPTTMIAIW